jgi:hypothetical protein
MIQDLIALESSRRKALCSPAIETLKELLFTR